MRARRPAGTIADMSYIDLMCEDEVVGQLADRFAALRDDKGFVPNAERALAGSPEIALAFHGLVRAIASSMGSRRYELIATAAARARHSRYCTLVHGQALAGVIGEDAVADILAGRPSAGLTAADTAIATFAEQAAVEPTAVTRADIDQLRDVGLSDDDIRDCVLAIALRCFATTALDALGIEPDAPLQTVTRRLMSPPPRRPNSRGLATEPPGSPPDAEVITT